MGTIDKVYKTDLGGVFVVFFFGPFSGFEQTDQFTAHNISQQAFYLCFESAGFSATPVIPGVYQLKKANSFHAELQGCHKQKPFVSILGVK